MFNYRVEKLDLAVNWKLSRNETLFKENFILELDNSVAEIAFNVRFGEDLEGVKKQLDLIAAKPIPNSLEEMKTLLASEEFYHSTRFGLESLYIHYFANQKNVSVCEVLGIEQPKSVDTSFSIPIMEVSEVKEYLGKYSGFSVYKLKLGDEKTFKLFEEVLKHTDKKIRVDANEAFKTASDVMHFVNSYDSSRIEFLEQPIAASSIDEHYKLYELSSIPVMADESIEDNADFDELSKRFHAVNVKLMKAGGYLKGIELLQGARNAGMKTMIGCMIETSIGVRSALYLSSLADWFDLDGFLLLKKDPFAYVENKEGVLSII